MRLTAVPRDALGAHFEPNQLLFRDGHTIDQFVWREQIAAAEAALVHHEFRIEFGEMVGDHPSRPLRAADLLVRIREQDDVS